MGDYFYVGLFASNHQNQWIFVPKRVTIKIVPTSERFLSSLPGHLMGGYTGLRIRASVYAPSLRYSGII